VIGSWFAALTVMGGEDVDFPRSPYHPSRITHYPNLVPANSTDEGLALVVSPPQQLG
jgi:hypothetical protein